MCQRNSKVNWNKKDTFDDIKQSIKRQETFARKKKRSLNYSVISGLYGKVCTTISSQLKKRYEATMTLKISWTKHEKKVKKNFRENRNYKEHTIRNRQFLRHILRREELNIRRTILKVRKTGEN